MEKNELNHGHIAELQDRLQVTVDYIEMVLAKHPLVEEISEFSDVIKDINGMLAALYQTVGQFDSVEELSLSQRPS